MDRVRVIVVGDSGVGKSSLIHLLAHDKVISNPSWTIGAAVDLRIHEYKQGTPAERSFFIELWDVGGNKSHANTRGVFYASGIHGVILCHDLSNKKSALNLNEWVREILAATETASSSSSSASRLLHGASSASSASTSSPYSSTSIPFLIVGTKLGTFMSTSATSDSSLLPRRRVRGCDDLQEELDAEEIFVDADDVAAFRLGSGNAVKLSRFFDRAVERRLRTEGGASVRPISSATGISSGDQASSSYGVSSSYGGSSSYGSRTASLGSSPNFSERRRAFNYPSNKNYYAD